MRYDKALLKRDSDADYARLKEAIERRNYWLARIRELIKGREKELGWLLIG